MGTMEDVKKAKQNFTQSQPGGPKAQVKETTKAKSWLTYDLKEDNERRTMTRKLLHILSVLKELGYPVKTCYSFDTLQQMSGGKETLDEVDPKKYFDVGIIELMKVEDEIANEITDFLLRKAITIFAKKNFKYSEGIETLRIFLSASSIKEVA